MVVRWLNPREFLTVWLSPDDGKAYLYRQTADRAEEEYVAVSSSGVTLTSGQWYDAKVVVHDDSGNQVLDFYVDANQDSDFLDAGEQLFDDEGAIDDNWSAGYVGLANWLETAQEFDDFEVGIDNNSDGDIADAGDDVQIDDDFSSTTMSLTYDDNGNLTDDGVFKFVYDAWNRLVTVTRRVDDKATIAAYEYDGQNRRTMKTVSNSGVEDTPNDGGQHNRPLLLLGWGGRLARQLEHLRNPQRLQPDDVPVRLGLAVHRRANLRRQERRSDRVERLRPRRAVRRVHGGRALLRPPGPQLERGGPDRLRPLRLRRGQRGRALPLHPLRPVHRPEWRRRQRRNG